MAWTVMDCSLRTGVKTEETTTTRTYSSMSGSATAEVFANLAINIVACQDYDLTTVARKTKQRALSV